MAKITILLPDSAMLTLALNAAKLYHLDLIGISIIDRGNFQEIAETIAQNGTDIIISRGGYAADIHQKLQIPVIDIKITTFEIGLMLQKAKKLSGKAYPTIALTGPRNMFVPINTSAFEDAYRIHLKLFLFDAPEEMEAAAQNAIGDGADIIIGGRVVCQYCQDMNITALRTFSGEESVLEACRMASLLSEALDQEKQHAASLNMLLDRVSSGIIEIDGQGAILRVNQFVEHLLMMDSRSLKGLPVQRILPGISNQLLKTALTRHKEVRSAAVRIQNSEFLISIAPVLVDNRASGAILSFHEMLPVTAAQHHPLTQKLLDCGFRATHTFDAVIARSPVMQELIRQARHFSRFPFPVLITGPDGTEKQIIAECIHNAGDFHQAPFLRYNCGTETRASFQLLLSPGDEEGQATDAAFDMGTPFTLYLHEVSLLTPLEQYRLLMLMQRYAADTIHSDMPARHRCIRIIASSSRDLKELVQNGQFRSDTYYALSVMCLELPPLKNRREDIMGWTDFYIGSLQKRYGRYIKFTKSAQDALLSYSWPGNLTELKTVCKRIFVNCQKYMVDSADIGIWLHDITQSDTGQKQENLACAPPAFYLPEAEQAARITEALRKNGGNRSAAAAELGISTTTLWRQMKKYRISKTEGKTCSN
ncbi:PrpR N-terminal domain-containing protein [Clostridium sp. AN503]|uniref:PrpR N-terminal domain-containing protein n=1 Tax=Clostridium sp. AN503 TaxID=3160598 RepID=UPI0034589B66